MSESRLILYTENNSLRNETSSSSGGIPILSEETSVRANICAVCCKRNTSRGGLECWLRRELDARMLVFVT